MLQARVQQQGAEEALNKEQGAEQLQEDPAPQELCPGAGRAGDTVSR